MQNKQTCCCKKKNSLNLRHEINSKQTERTVENQEQNKKKEKGTFYTILF